MLHSTMKACFAISVWACSSFFPFLLPILIESDYIMRFSSLASPACGHLMLFGFGYIYGFCTKENSPLGEFFSAPFLFSLYAADINWQSHVFYTIQASAARVLKFRLFLSAGYTSPLRSQW